MLVGCWVGRVRVDDAVTIALESSIIAVSELNDPWSGNSGLLVVLRIRRAVCRKSFNGDFWESEGCGQSRDKGSDGEGLEEHLDYVRIRE